MTSISCLKLRQAFARFRNSASVTASYHDWDNLAQLTWKVFLGEEKERALVAFVLASTFECLGKITGEGVAFATLHQAREETLSALRCGVDFLCTPNQMSGASVAIDIAEARKRIAEILKDDL